LGRKEGRRKKARTEKNFYIKYVLSEEGNKLYEKKNGGAI
jgi:hypothetical protein